MRFTLANVVLATLLIVTPAAATPVAAPFPQGTPVPTCAAKGLACTGIGALPCCTALRCQVDETVSVGVSTTGRLQTESQLLTRYNL